MHFPFSGLPCEHVLKAGHTGRHTDMHKTDIRCWLSYAYFPHAYLWVENEKPDTRA